MASDPPGANERFIAVTKRILQIIPSLDRAGAEKQFTLLATRLDRNEFDVHACALTRGGPEQRIDEIRAAL